MKKPDNDIIGIYKITNPKGKIYIGQSTNIYKRWKHNYNNIKFCKKQPKLFYSLQKYGVENHKFEIIEECQIEDLNHRERYWQDYYNVLEEGLNCVLTETTELPKTHSLDTINKLKGQKRSIETREKMSKSAIGRTGNFKGHTHTEENRKKIGEARIFYQSKPIIQYDRFGVFIKEWSSSKEACESLKIHGRSLIRCLEDFTKTCDGCKWKRKFEID